MTITIHNTTKVLTLKTEDGGSVKARVWEGITEKGVKVACLMTRIAVHNDDDASQFERELTEVTPPSSEIICWPLSMIL
jgi:hypothetical protein